MTEARPEVRIALEQAWEAYCHGSFPVGSVILDPVGAIVAVGRNRMGESNAPDGRLRATAIAHAEMDVLAQLPPGEYTDYRLITTLEPCLLCRSAATLASMGTVEYLAADLLWEGLEALPTLNSQVARRHPNLIGPHIDAYALFASVLPMALTIAFSSRGGTSRDYELRSPAAYAIALRIVENDDWPARSLDLDGAMTHLNSLAQ
jgi:tRNA(Arg) A34 adenosine deaminase TadA